MNKKRFKVIKLNELSHKIVDTEKSIRWNTWDEKKTLKYLNKLSDERNYLLDEIRLLKNKLHKVDDILPYYLTCAEIRDFHHDLYEEEIALARHYKEGWNND